MRRFAAPLACVLWLAAPAAAAGSPLPQEGQSTAREKSVLIKAAPGVAADVAERYGVSVLRSFPQIGWSELTLGSDADATLDALNADTDVKGVDFGSDDEDFKVQFQPRDKIWNGNAPVMGFNGSPTALPWNYTIANFPAAWDQTRGASSTVVGVIDSEFDTEHPDLKTKFRSGYNVNSGTAQYHTGDVRATACDQVHGTHVAGTIGAATDNQVGTSGAGFDVTMLPVRASFNFQVGGGATDAKFVADVTEGLLWIADRGVVAVNMSFGTTRPHEPLQAAINYAVSKGVTLIAAAGNDQQRQPGVPHYPASYPNVIAVAATTPADDVSSFSSNGDYVDVAAPGEPIYSTWETRCQSSIFQNGNEFTQGYEMTQGTSMAAPLVAGLVGLMKTVRPDLAPSEVEAILKSTARDLGAAGHDPVFGAGRIDANAAVSAARAFTRPVPPPPPPAPPAPPPPAAPKTVVTISGKPSYNRKTRTLSVKLLCPKTQAFCAGTVAIKGGGRTLGTRAFSLDKGKRTTVRIKFTKKGLSKAAKGKAKLKLTVNATARDSGGVKRTTKKTVTIRR